MRKVLSVDDSGVIRRIVGRGAELLGYGLLEAGNGEEALALLERRHAEVALVVMDVNMPNMDGFECLERIKAHPDFRAIPVMMLTTVSERGNIIRALKAGAVNYLCKPFAAEDLVMKIQQSLGAGLG